VYGATVTVTVEVGAVTSARLNSACALFGTSRIACTSGHTTGRRPRTRTPWSRSGWRTSTPSQP
jgi:hypothetical protein